VFSEIAELKEKIEVMKEEGRLQEQALKHYQEKMDKSLQGMYY
jgi:hypothetical protein